MSRWWWLALFAAICALYTTDRLWALGAVLHCLLMFAWLVVPAKADRDDR